MSHYRLLANLLSVGLVTSQLIGCSKHDAPEDALPSNQLVATQQPADSELRSRPKSKITEASRTEAITAGEVEDFARKLTNAYARQDVMQIADAIDWQSIAERSTTGLNYSEEEKRLAIGSLIKDIEHGNHFANQLIREGGPRSSWHKVGIRTENGSPELLMRLNMFPGVSYHFFSLSKRNGQLVAANIYSLPADETMAQTLRRTLLLQMASIDVEMKSSLSEIEVAIFNHRDLWKQMMFQLARGDAQTAFDTYESLPAVLREDKAMMILRYGAGLRVGKEEELRAISDYRATHADAGGIDLLLLDAYSLRGQHQKALECIDRISNLVCRDPYLDVLRGNILYAQGSKEEALQSIKRACQALPDVEACHWSLVAASRKAKRFDLTSEALHALEFKCGVNFPDLRSLPEYVEFLESTHGKRWVAEH